MSNAASPYFRDGRSFPSRAQMLAAVSDFDMLAAQGLALNDIADALEVTPGTVCVIARWSWECAMGLEPAFEVRFA